MAQFYQERGKPATPAPEVQNAQPVFAGEMVLDEPQFLEPDDLLKQNRIEFFDFSRRGIYRCLVVCGGFS